MKNKTRVTRKIITILLTAAMVLALTACGGNSVQSVKILYNGTETERLEIYQDEEITLTAVIDPENTEEEIVWSSDDAGAVKPKPSEDGKSCYLDLKKTGAVRITLSCGEQSTSVKVVVSRRPAVTYGEENYYDEDIALTIDGVKYPYGYLQLEYVDQYYYFVDEYSGYTDLDTTYGLYGLESQTYTDEDGNTKTWKEYFLETSVNALTGYQAMRSWAAENGISLTDEDTAEVTESVESLRQSAMDSGYSTLKEYLSNVYGNGISEELFLNYQLDQKLVNKAIEAYLDQLSFTDEEIEEYYQTMGYGEGNDYNLVSMRHILIMAESDEDGNYTDEAIQAAHDRIEEIYAEWQAGEATEESFAALAEEYSEDSGSNTAGGLYEDIYKGRMVTAINDYIFDESRRTGDVAVIDIAEHYTGTHLVYFAGTGERYDFSLALPEMQENALNELADEASENYVVEYGPAWENIG